MATDRDFMRLALREARKGLGRTSPNPAVGAVVVNQGTVVGRGYHRRAGTPHAEPHALVAAGPLAEGATLYVTLEPCNHHGRTPPCTEAIINSGISRVVVGMADPNPAVAGGGCEHLRRLGVAVECGILEEECREINRPFIKHATTGLPWVIMKAGMSLDGRIAARRGVCTAITGELSRRYVHRLRDRVDAILVGIETALVDDPCLTTRLEGRKGRDPVRVILDSALRLPSTARMIAGESAAPTWIFCAAAADSDRRQQLEEAGVTVKSVPTGADGRVDLGLVLRELGRCQLQSVLVEGGSLVHGAFLARGLVDRIALFVAPLFLGEAGVPLLSLAGRLAGMDLPRLTGVRVRRLGEDLLIEGRPVRSEE